MSLSELLLAKQLPKGPNCSVGLWLDTIPEAERAEWDEALANLRIQSTTINRHLESLNVRLSADAIRRHRGGRCLCPKP